MKKLCVFFIIIFSSVITSFFSCYPEPLPPPPPPLPPPGAPIANAGNNQAIFLPKDSVVLDATASEDPDGTISGFQWSKIAGPASYAFTDSTAAITVVNHLMEGTYQFELTVTDNEGLIAKDIMEVTVYPGVIAGCDGDSRPLINVSLTQIGTLSQARIPFAAAAGSKIVFAGGPYINGPWYYISAAFDIYDINSKTWGRGTLSKEREGIAAVSCENKIFFAGGGFGDGGSWGEWAFDYIDIYDVSTNTWATANLSVPRSYLTAATVGNKVFFAGGFTNDFNDAMVLSSRVDIYDLSTNTWTTAELSQPRYRLTAVTVGDKIYFAGGDGASISTRVDIYNYTTNSWSTSELKKLAGAVSGVAVGDKIYWAGITQGQNKGEVEIWNTTTGDVTFNCLSYPRYAPAALVNNNEIIFFSSSSEWNNEVDFVNNLNPQFDIYNLSTNQWSIGVLPQPVIAPGIVSVNNSIYMGGGRTGRQSCTDKVYILNW